MKSPADAPNRTDRRFSPEATYGQKKQKMEPAPKATAHRGGAEYLIRSIGEGQPGKKNGWRNEIKQDDRGRRTPAM